MKRGFTLIELLVVVGIIAVLAALLLPTLTKARGAARKAACINNARQINIAIRMYADDHADAIHAATNKEAVYFTYRESIQPYLSRNGSPASDPVFVCPADDFDCDDAALKRILWENVSGKGFHRQEYTRHASYFFNGLAPEDQETRMSAKPFSSVREPSRLILAGELSGVYGLSTHERNERYQFNNARNVMSFVDGHVSLIRMYWNGVLGWENSSFFYEPPTGYEYHWNEK